MTTEHSVCVLYHANCPDGFGAAFAAWKHFGDAAVYLPVAYGQPLPDGLAGKTVYIVDFSYPRAELLALQRHTQHLSVFDHHTSAQADLGDLPFAVFDMDKSGAGLTWEAFHGLPLPRMIAYIQDRDLWRWALPNSREVSLWQWTQPRHFQAWDLAYHVLETQEGFERAVGEGKAIRRYADMLVQEQARRMEWRRVDTPAVGYVVPVVNATTLFSEVGDSLCQQHPAAPFVAYYFDREDQKRQWGLRSRGGFDCSVVAKAYGGGGHAGAAGFVTALGWLPEFAPGEEQGRLHGQAHTEKE